MAFSELLTKLNEGMDALDEKFIYDEEQYDGSEIDSASILQTFEDSQVEKSVFQLTFDFYDGKGCLIQYNPDADITFRLQIEDLIPGSWGEVDMTRGANWLNRDISVTVKAVDYETRTVYFSAVQEFSERSQVYNEIYNRLRAKADPSTGRVPAEDVMKGIKGTVVRIYPNRITVNLLRLGVLGVLFIPDWHKDFTINMEAEVQVGQTYTFDIIGFHNLRNTNVRLFTLSHEAYTRTAWEKLVKYPIGEGTTLSVRCVRVVSDNATWYGVSSNGKTLPAGMVLTGHYKKGEGGFAPKVGDIVQARIEYFNPERQRIMIQAYRPDTRKGYFRAPEETKRPENK